jgi:SAM-dependent methyltransferase
MNLKLNLYASQVRKTSADDYYENFYRSVMTKGIIGIFVGLYHKHLEFKFDQNTNFDRVLEVGAGNCEHIYYVRHKFLEYVATDIRIEPLISEVSKMLGQTVNPDIAYRIPNSNRSILVSEVNAQDLSRFPDNSFDRVIAGCLILHLEVPELALQEWRRVTKNGGQISIYVHSEPGVLLRFARAISTSLRGRRLGINHIHNVYREHKIHFLAIKNLVDDVFEDDKVKFNAFPVPKLSWNFSLWKVVQIKKSQKR